MNAYDIIKKPLMTEKISALNAIHTYCFKVSRLASKIQIKQALKEIFGADIDEVRLVNIPGKTKYMRKGPAQKRAEYRKAYITVKNKGKLDISKVAKEDKEVKIKEAPVKLSRTETARPKSKNLNVPKRTVFKKGDK